MTSGPTEGRTLERLTLAEYADALAAGTPAPGGGSALALAGALAAALAAMAARLTVGRERYAAVEPRMAALIKRADGLRSRLLGLADDDARAYAEVAAAYRLPAGAGAERAARRAAVTTAMTAATAVPLAVAEAAVESLRLCEAVAAAGNRNALGDAVAGALLAHAGLEGSAWNVRWNTRLLGAAEPGSGAAEERIAELLQAGHRLLDATLAAAGAGG